MKFEEFKTNVQQWAAERGIYEHSTATAQALKACSEAGELCDAVVKGDRAALIDAIGDVAVCLVNVAKLHNCSIDMTTDFVDECYSEAHGAAAVVKWCADVAGLLGMAEIADSEINEALYALQDFCSFVHVDLEACCESAWNEIKDRKGRMVPGGAFVKE